jgi:Rieske Fe-S protein
VDRDRRLICKAGLVLGAASVLPACGDGTTVAAVCTAGAVGVGNAADVPLNGAVLHPTPQANVFICHDAQGFYAVDAGCTHLGCDVEMKAAGDLKQGFNCPCHGATYDANGDKPTAPAPTPLRHYLLCAQPSGALVVDVTQNGVDATVRLKL